MIKTALTTAFLAFQAISILAEDVRCEPGPCVPSEVVALESSECQQYHIFIARGSDSSYPGHQGPLVKLICDQLEDCGYEDISYPANSSSTGPGNWCPSAHKGAINGQEQLNNYAQRCPYSKLILTGFSQGASVVLDIIGGGGGGPGFDCEWQEPNYPLSRSELPGWNIAAVLAFGAVVRSAGQNYTLEKGMIVDGQSPRDFDGKETRKLESLGALNQYADVLLEYCNVGDPVCAKDSVPSDIMRHLNYFDLYNYDAAAWVVSKVSGNAYEAEGNSEHNDQIKTSTSSSSSNQAEKTSGPEASNSIPEAAMPTSKPNGTERPSHKFAWTFLAVLSTFVGIGMI